MRARFCEDPSEAGSFGYKHCFEHKEEWVQLASWIRRYWEFIIPSLGPELTLVSAYAGLSLVGWINWIISFLFFGLVVWGLAKAYAWCYLASQPKRAA